MSWETLQAYQTKEICADMHFLLVKAGAFLLTPRETLLVAFVPKHRYICHAIEYAAKYHGMNLSYGRERLLSTISERLQGHATLEFWLNRNGVSVSDQTPALMQDYRHRWLQELIKEFSA
jgi:hypothetical protein